MVEVMWPPWCSGTSPNASGLLRHRHAGGMAVPLVDQTGRGRLIDRGLRDQEELTRSLPGAPVSVWTLGLWPERGREEPRSTESKPKPKSKSRPKQVEKDKPAPSEATNPQKFGPPRPLTLEAAVDTWVVVLGIREIDEGTNAFLPERVVGAIQETFMGFEGADRLTMALAFTRVVQNLLSSVGHLLEQSVTSSGTSARDADPAEEVEVEVDDDDDDSSIYIQLNRGLKSSRGCRRRWKGSARGPERATSGGC